ALCGLLALLLALPVVGVLIALDSPGPIFYRQERLGYRGKKFAIYKFRSMRLDAEREGRAAWTSEHDPRITGIGRFMRATHLDELPQVLNVLRGEMSVIGPRPEREEFVKELEKTVPFYRCRLMVKPGLSGWAQVKYHYGRSDYDALVKLQYDLYYIKHQSFLLDVFILLKTVGEVFSLNGA
ncbi:MAG TPA: sugar transferase, partial [Ktedonobacteraceae bacterium]|nr:sugar transferase [Ktedonobacteraceae bacterium]